jgi:succinate dehydrogenase / fumarate reductase cytochrome b subunit
MNAVRAFVTSTIGKKVVMASTGVILFGFVVAHMLGNLQVYLGPGPMNEYAHSLRELLHGAGLWIARAGLFIAAVLHVWAAASLTIQDRAARPVGYRQWQARESNYASRTMRWTGVFLFVFIVFHILHFTTGHVHPHFVEGDVYANFITGFRVVPVTIFYILAMLLLGLHLAHGSLAMVRSLGLAHPKYVRVWRTIGWSLAALVVVGNLTFPIAVLLGWIR